ncbi:hypothetical protein [Nocardioides lijunqiniae]|uniref:hypothetical protein n=1 Tax=Nocardioides lijunqiniae TaxID=2760832 RepID=UPI001877B45F|nr:hypothetical protein [Nocardioides lijunqiniae]
MPPASERLASLTADLLVRDLPEAAPHDAAAVGRATARHLASLPVVTRAGVRVAQAVVVGSAGVLGRRPYSRMTPQARADVVHRLAGSSLPLVAEYFRLVRGVALMVHHEDAR